MKNVMITTKHAGVFIGQIEESEMDKTTVAMKNAVMAIRWGTTKGVMELCHTGPTKDSNISAPSDIPVLRDVSAIFYVSDEAWEKWKPYVNA